MNDISSLPVSSSPFDVAANSVADRLRTGGLDAVGKVAKDFESLFVSIVLKEMRQTLGPGSLFGNDTGDINGSLFDMFMGKHLVDAGGFGVARTLEKSMAGR